MGRKRKNLIGNKYGRLTVISNIEEKTKYGDIQVICKCDCDGNLKEYSKNSLVRGRTRSCGCLQKEVVSGMGRSRGEDVIGNKYGRLTVIKMIEMEGNDRYVLCQCDCGNVETIHNLSSLRSGRATSCGCYRAEMLSNRREDIIGNRYGRLLVISEDYKPGRKDRYFLCQCDCGSPLKRIGFNQLKSGRTVSCGCYKIEMTKKKLTYQLKDYQEKHPLFCQIEEIMDDPDNPGIMVRCKLDSCKEWFTPTKWQIERRIGAIERPKSLSIENNFYCSEKCKQMCDTYNTNSVPKSLRNIKKVARCNQPINRKALMDLQIDECGYNYCEKCGKPFNPEDLALHHNIMVSKDHDMADDMSHQLLCCRKCHKHKGC